MAPLLNYFKLLKKNTVPFHCPHCHDLLLAEFFEHHCLMQHALNSDVSCVWCFGYTFWPEGDKDRHVDHLLACYSMFLQSQTHSPTVIPQPETPTVFDLELMCEEKQFDYHLPLPDLPEHPVWELQPQLKGIPFQCPRLNLAVACMQLYLDTQHDSAWHHVMVRAPAFLSFVRALDADGGKTHTLPFSCFCDGGGMAHRHFILKTTPKRSFLTHTWKKIKCSHKTSNIKKQPIASPMELVALLSSVSQRQSQCDFTVQTMDPGLEPVGELTHYYIAKSLPAFSKILLTLQWDGGILELVQRLYATIEPQVLAPVALSFNGLVAIHIRDLPGILKNWVLPVSKHFQPTVNRTEFYIHLFQNEKIFFEPCDKPILDWENGQAEKGNVFYEAIGNALYYPTPYQQKSIRLLKPLVDNLMTLQNTVTNTTTQRQELEVSLARLRKTHTSLKRKYNQSEKQLKNVQGKLIQYLEMENDKLKMERDCFKKSKRLDDSP